MSSEQSRGGWFALVVIGSVLTLVATCTVFGVGFFLALASPQSDGYLQTPAAHISSSGYAVSTPPALLETDLDSLPTINVSLSAESETVPVFIGVGPSSEVSDYLAGVHIGEIAGGRSDWPSVNVRDVAGSRVPEEPEGQSFWAARASGTGHQQLTWTVQPGDWTVVVMNADASPAVVASVAVGVQAPWAAPLAAGVIVAMGILALIGFALIIVGAYGWGRVSAGMASSPIRGSHYPAAISGELRGTLSRWLWLVKWVLVIPHAIVLGLLWVAFAVVTVAAGFAILFTGHYPRPLFEFTVGVLRWNWRVNFYAYSALATDQYPPFSLDSTDYPADLSVDYPERLSHGLVLVKSWLLAIPHLLIVGVITGGGWSIGWMLSYPGRWWGAGGASLLALLLLVTAVILLFTGRYQRPLFDLIMGLNRWVFRVMTYVALMRDEYPPFRLDQGGQEPAEPDAVPVAKETQNG